MFTAQNAPIGGALRSLLPDGADPYHLLSLAAEAAVLVRDEGDLAVRCRDVARCNPDLAGALIVVLAACVDTDSSLTDLLGWLATNDGRADETIRMAAAREEALAGYGPSEPAQVTPPKLSIPKFDAKVKEMHTQRKNDHEIGKELKVSPTRVRDSRLRQGLKAVKHLLKAEFEARLVELHTRGKNDREIALILGRDPKQIRNVRSDLGLPAIGRKRRPVLVPASHTSAKAA